MGISVRLTSMSNAKNVYLFSTSSHPQAIHVNSLDIDFYKPDIDSSQYDYFIVTSKQVAKVLEFYKVSNIKPALCISKGTAAAYKKIGGEVVDVASGYGASIASELRRYPKKSRWLYLRAEEVASNFVDELVEDGYSIHQSVVYKSKCSEEINKVEVENDATLIFTSPSSVKCFLKRHTILSTHKVIVIGKTTAKVLPKDIEFTLSKEPTIDACIEIS